MRFYRNSDEGRRRLERRSHDDPAARLRWLRRQRALGHEIGPLTRRGSVEEGLDYARALQEGSGSAREKFEGFLLEHTLWYHMTRLVEAGLAEERRVACNRAAAALRRLAPRIRRSRRSRLLQETHGPRHSLEAWAREVVGDGPVNAIMIPLQGELGQISDRYQLRANAMTERRRFVERMVHWLAWQATVHRSETTEFLYRTFYERPYRGSRYGARHSGQSAMLYLASQGVQGRMEYIRGEPRRSSDWRGIRSTTYYAGERVEVFANVESELDISILNYRREVWRSPYQGFEVEEGDIIRPVGWDDAFYKEWGDSDHPLYMDYHKTYDQELEQQRERFEREGALTPPLEGAGVPIPSEFVRNPWW